MHQLVPDYYGQSGQASRDLKTSACCNGLFEGYSGESPFGLADDAGKAASCC
jgi:hypothetical protein